MIRYNIKNRNTTLTEKLRNYQRYHQAKLINTNILQAMKYLTP